MTAGEAAVDAEVGWLVEMRGAGKIDRQVCWPVVIMVATVW